MSKTVLFQVSISMQFNSIWPVKCYHSGPLWTWKRWQRRGTPHSTTSSITRIIRLFSVISRTLCGMCVCVGGGLFPLCRDAVGVFYSPCRLGKFVWTKGSSYRYCYLTIIILFNFENSIQLYSLICAWSNSPKYCNVMFLHTMKRFQIFHPNNFICTRLHGIAI